MYASGAAQEALVEQYNDQLRELREAGLSETAEEVRDALRALRDEERAPESSVKVDQHSVLFQHIGVSVLEVQQPLGVCRDGSVYHVHFL